MTAVPITSSISVTPLPGALGAVVEGFDPAGISDDDLEEITATLLPRWDEYLVLFFPRLRLEPAEQVRFASCLGTRLAATTEVGNDYRNAPTMGSEGHPEILVLDSQTENFDARATAVWHTDVTFAETPPKASLFVMDIPAVNGGDTMWSNQIRAHAALSGPIRDLIGGLNAVHGRPPLTGTATHPMVRSHHASGEPALYVNRGWTSRIDGLSNVESTKLLEAIFTIAERPDLQMRWRWSEGDVALWDNRYTMHYAVNDYAGQRRRARRVTIYDA